MKIVFSLCILIITLFSSTNKDKVTLHLKWLHQYQFAGYYVAKEKGFYNELGLDVTIAEPDIGADLVSTVINNEAHYAIGSSTLLIEHSHKKPIVALFPLLQFNPDILVMIKKDGGSDKINLRNKKILIREGDKNGEFTDILKKYHASDKNIYYNNDENNLKALLSGKYDAVYGYLQNEPFVIEEMGLIPVSIHTSSKDFYGDILYTSKKEIKNHLKRMQKFKEASLKGWRYAMDNIEETVKIVQKAGSIKSIDALTYEARMMRELMIPNIVEIGYCTSRQWQEMVQNYKEQGLIDSSYDLKGFLYEDMKPKPSLLETKSVMLFLLIFSVSAIFLILIFYFTNKGLKRKISKEIEIRYTQEKMMAQQAKSAEMGEMLSMIAHQWRQPLSSISAVTSNILMKIELEEDLKQEETVNSLHRIDSYVQHLSKTIDNFRNFFKPSVNKDEVCIKECIENAIDLINHTLVKNSIHLEYDFLSLPKINIYKNDFIQVLINIYKNAVDTFIERSTISPVLKTIVKQDGKNIFIIIKDNAGGVDIEFLEKIFEPYFSTKGKNGTGLGLYMSKMIIQEHLDGEIFVQNDDEGACFTIKIVSQIDTPENI